MLIVKWVSGVKRGGGGEPPAVTGQPSPPPFLPPSILLAPNTIEAHLHKFLTGPLPPNTHNTSILTR